MYGDLDDHDQVDDRSKPRRVAGSNRGSQLPAGKQAVGIPRRGHTVGTGYVDALVITHVEGGVPARLSAEDTHLIGLCTQPRARDRAAGAVPKNGLPARSGVGGMVLSLLDPSKICKQRSAGPTPASFCKISASLCEILPTETLLPSVTSRNFNEMLMNRPLDPTPSHLPSPS